MRILVTGANGQVGRELSRRGARKGFDILALDRATLDITDESAVNREVSGSGASVVVNAAAYTAVDQAELEPELAFAVNRDGPAYFASACAETGVPLVHISTDFVFDGQKSAASGGRSICLSYLCCRSGGDNPGDCWQNYTGATDRLGNLPLLRQGGDELAWFCRSIFCSGGSVHVAKGEEDRSHQYG